MQTCFCQWVRLSCFGELPDVVWPKIAQKVQNCFFGVFEQFLAKNCSKMPKNRKLPILVLPEVDFTKIAKSSLFLLWFQNSYYYSTYVQVSWFASMLPAFLQLCLTTDGIWGEYLVKNTSPIVKTLTTGTMCTSHAWRTYILHIHKLPIRLTLAAASQSSYVGSLC